MRGRLGTGTEGVVDSHRRFAMVPGKPCLQPETAATAVLLEMSQVKADTRFVRWYGAVLAAALVMSGVAASATVPQAGSGGAVVKVAFNKKLKRKILVNGAGRTLYVFTADTGGTSNCLDDGTSASCTKLWPALVTTAPPVAGKGVAPAKLDTFTRPDGKLQVRYFRHPLYTFHGGLGTRGDRKPGEIRGQGFFQSWYVLSPKGKLIRAKG
jgi:predicted lipoprotein with Yx(FWY)xxD motif